MRANPIPILDIAGRLLAATLCGFVIGWDRQFRGKPAGLRTHMMVSLGAASVTAVAVEWFSGVQAGAAGDPTRVIQGVIGGLGFLGAGSIIQSRGSVHGITTAAAIWVAGALGVACGAGQLAIAGITLILAFLILTVMLRVERKISAGQASLQGSSEESDPSGGGQAGEP